MSMIPARWNFRKTEKRAAGAHLGGGVCRISVRSRAEGTSRASVILDSVGGLVNGRRART